MTYRSSGVDINAMDRALAGIRASARTTFGPEVLGGVGGFGGLFRPDWSRYRDPVLVASTDGVGTKLKVAAAVGIHDTVGRDLVNHCVNDILCQGAEPLFFLDYIAMGRLQPEVVEALVRGLAAACRENGCALLGGETAEMPGLYADGDFDLAGTIVGVADRDHLIDGAAITPGDRLLGLASTGLHTNGYSLARRLFFEILGWTPDRHIEALGRTLAEVLLEPHRSYLGPIAPLLGGDSIRGLAHVTGGGITDNLPRILPPGCRARIDRGAWEVPPLFRLIAEQGKVAEAEMFRTFNMGIGMIVVAAAAGADPLERQLAEAGEKVCRIGQIEAGDPGVVYDRGRER